MPLYINGLVIYLLPFHPSYPGPFLSMAAQLIHYIAGRLQLGLGQYHGIRPAARLGVIPSEAEDLAGQRPLHR